MIFEIENFQIKIEIELKFKIKFNFIRISIIIKPNHIGPYRRFGLLPPAYNSTSITNATTPRQSLWCKSSTNRIMPRQTVKWGWGLLNYWYTLLYQCILQKYHYNQKAFAVVYRWTLPHCITHKHKRTRSASDRKPKSSRRFLQCQWTHTQVIVYAKKEREIQR